MENSKEPWPMGFLGNWVSPEYCLNSNNLTRLTLNSEYNYDIKRIDSFYSDSLRLTMNSGDTILNS